MVKFINIVFLIFVSFAHTARLRFDKESTEVSLPLFSTQKKLTDCNSNTCNGKCIKNICHCDNDYIDITSIKPNDLACSYKQKKLIFSFYLEFLLPGVGHIYANRIIFGVIKMFIFGLLLFMVKSISNKITYGYLFKIIITLMLHLADIFSFLLNKYTDGYGIPLIPLNINK
jgi:hypothetical protein